MANVIEFAPVLLIAVEAHTLAVRLIGQQHRREEAERRSVGGS
jgi:hypothetical protein